MKLYVVRNKEGKFFRPIGRGGYGPNWHTELEKAKFYAKFGQAKARVTTYARNSPKLGVCEILEFDLDPNAAKVMNMEDDTNRTLAKARLAEEERKLKNAQYQLERLQAEKDMLEARIHAVRVSIL